MIMVNVADLIDPNDAQGRSYREVNAGKVHNIPIGALVEVSGSRERLYVKRHTRDCDKTPLYSLGMQHTESSDNGICCKLEHGYPEDSLTVVG